MLSGSLVREQINLKDRKAVQRFLSFNPDGGVLSLATVENPYLEACYLLMEDNQVVGRFALYRNDLLSYEGQTVICIGSYACVQREGIGSSLLRWAIGLCQSRDYGYCVGPMHGSTWETYRFGTDNKNPLFMMDIQQPHYYVQQFEEAGFRTIANYTSALELVTPENIRDIQAMDSYFTMRGFKVRSLDITHLEKELYAVADFSNEAFKDNFLFTPIERELFVQKYAKLSAMMDPQYIWIAEDTAGKICSILFALKDMSASQGETLVIKTVAAKPGFQYRGLTTYLVRKLTKTTFDDGYKKIVHAFMHTDNLSSNASKKFGETIREYSLFALALKF